MSCPFPPELQDHIIDHLHDEPTTLKTCCLVSKSWVPRTRTHLFDHVKFHREGPHIDQWDEAFPDLSNSPNHSTRTLSVGFKEPIADAETETLRSFRGISYLAIDTAGWYDRDFSFVPLHGLSPVMRSLHITLCIVPISDVLDLVCSFPLLEDLWLCGHFYLGKDDVWEAPSTSPRFTGSLGLRLKGGVKYIVERLADLPNGLNFKRITVDCETPDDVRSTQDLVLRCSDTLESVGVIDHFREVTSEETLSLSKATRLKRAEFECTPRVQWIVDELSATEFGNIRSILLVMSDFTVSEAVDMEDVHQEWADLDDLLVRFQTSSSVRMQLKCLSKRKWEDLKNDVARILPESMRRGVIDLVRCDASVHDGIEWKPHGLYESG